MKLAAFFTVALTSIASAHDGCPISEGLIVQPRDWGTHPYHECSTNNECHFIQHYRVHIGGVWVDVPSEAVITQSARKAIVWAAYIDGKPTIRCFLPKGYP